MSGRPAGASVSIRFDGSRCFRETSGSPRIRPNGTREARAITRVTRRLMARRCGPVCYSSSFLIFCLLSTRESSFAILVHEKEKAKTKEANRHSPFYPLFGFDSNNKNATKNKCGATYHEKRIIAFFLFSWRKSEFVLKKKIEGYNPQNEKEYHCDYFMICHTP